MRKRIKIHIGEIYTSSEPTIINTILGSCVSVCLFDPVQKVGGMNHILLPGKADLDKYDSSFRYGINAMEMLINSMMKLGSRKKNFFSKIFGGAHIIQSVELNSSPGLKNIKFVEEFLEMEGIPIVSRDTGGVNARRIYFHTNSGDVFLKTLPAFSFSAVSREEKEYGRKVRKEIQAPSDVELFRKGS